MPELPVPGSISSLASDAVAEAVDIAAQQAPLLRDKQQRRFEIFDIDRDGFVTPADTTALARKLARLTGHEPDSPRSVQLEATIAKI
ncbi:EF-hand domain-containing protein [Nocardia sp. N2S4-5]|uniref:EF-hand domain-containing protein n=1 Tax=Nocardia sp. N2S4-5 TaxID=3351565 RepID=UPI0037D8F928